MRRTKMRGAAASFAAVVMSGLTAQGAMADAGLNWHRVIAAPTLACQRYDEPLDVFAAPGSTEGRAAVAAGRCTVLPAGSAVLIRGVVPRGRASSVAQVVGASGVRYIGGMSWRGHDADHARLGPLKRQRAVPFDVPLCSKVGPLLEWLALIGLGDHAEAHALLAFERRRGTCATIPGGGTVRLAIVAMHSGVPLAEVEPTWSDATWYLPPTYEGARTDVMDDLGADGLRALGRP